MDQAERDDEQTGSAATPAPLPHPQDAARLRRAAALKAAEGLWKDRVEMAKDGVQVQEQLRAEWH